MPNAVVDPELTFAAGVCFLNSNPYLRDWRDDARRMVGGSLRILWVTWVLVAALTIRFIAAVFRLGAYLHTIATMPVTPFLQNGNPMFSERVVAWALSEFPQIFVYIVEIIMVQGVYEVWWRLRRARLRRQHA